MSSDTTDNPRPTIISPDTQRGDDKARLPPGQSLTKKWPVLTYGKTPKVDPHSPDWEFRVFGMCDNEYELNYAEIRALPSVDVFCDMHCVTRWSRLNNRFTGVQTKLILERAKPKPEVRFVMCHCELGFTVNVPIEEFIREDSILAYQWEGADLTPEHGWPLRGIVPRLYLWKSPKWVRGLELRASDAPGFWEQNGYHMHGDPWKEERFSW